MARKPQGGLFKVTYTAAGDRQTRNVRTKDPDADLQDIADVLQGEHGKAIDLLRVRPLHIRDAREWVKPTEAPVEPESSSGDDGNEPSGSGPYDPVDITDDIQISLSELGIDEKRIGHLEAAGITTLAELDAYLVDHEDLTELDGIGKISHEAIIEAVEAYRAKAA